MLKIFEHENANIRTVMVDSEPWFVGKDVAEVLGYKDTDYAVRTHCKAAKSYAEDSSGQVRHIKIIPERDVYRLVMRSKLPSAEKFEEWVVGTVLPFIRKTGGYVAGEEHAQSEEEVIMLAMQMLQRKIDAMKPKAEYHDKWMTSEGSYTTTAIAKQLGTTAVKLNKFLRKQGVKWENKDLPKAGYEDWFKIVTRSYTNSNGVEEVTQQCRVSPEGAKNIVNLFGSKAA